MFEAVILAAGAGTRLGCPAPKVLLDVGGRTLLERHLEILRPACSIRVVTGSRAGLVAAALPAGVEAVPNRDWESTGTLGSLMCAAPFGSGDLVVVHGDLLWTAGMLRAVLSTEGDVVIPVDSRSGGDEAMKVETRDGLVVRMSKSLPEDRSSGESMGIFLFRRLSLATLLELAPALAARIPTAAVDDLVNEMSDSGAVGIVPADVTASEWEEVDTPGDLERARRMAGR
jgi:choline kinase